MSHTSQFFDTNGVHLQAESGMLFIGCIISSAEAHFNPGPVVDLEEEEYKDKMVMNQTAEITIKKTSDQKVTFNFNPTTK